MMWVGVVTTSILFLSELFSIEGHERQDLLRH